MPILPGKLPLVVDEIKHNLPKINAKFGNGPSLYFYRRVRALRKANPTIAAFIANRYCLEMLYAALVSWGMDSQSAIMKSFPDFCLNLRATLPLLLPLDMPSAGLTRPYVYKALTAIYPIMRLMDTKGRLVSTSKCLHFLFPKICVPMDRRNSLKKLYGSIYEPASIHRSLAMYLEVTDFAYNALTAASPIPPIDKLWNTCPMKMVDNAIILMP